MFSYSVIRFCAIECALQMSGERSVAWMVDAWGYARGQADKPPTVDDVLTLGRLVEPYDNVHGFRRVPVSIGTDVKMNWKIIPSQMVNLMESVDSSYPAEFFKEFEEIHPFVDGNGRTGQILFNWLNGTLDDPVWAPNIWSDSRRTEGNGA